MAGSRLYLVRMDVAHDHEATFKRRLRQGDVPISAR